MLHSIQHLRSKFDRASALVDCALTFLEGQQMTVDTARGIVARINELTGILYRLVQIHKTLDRFEKNPAAARDLEALFYSLQGIIDKFSPEQPPRPPRFDPPPPVSPIFQPGGCSTTCFSAEKDAPRTSNQDEPPAITHAALQRISPLALIPGDPETTQPALSEDPNHNSDFMNAPTAKTLTSRITKNPTPKKPAITWLSPTRFVVNDPPVISPNPTDYIKYRDFFDKIRPVAPLALRPISRLLTGCIQCLDEFICDIAPRLLHALRVRGIHPTDPFYTSILNILVPAPLSFSP